MFLNHVRHEKVTVTIRMMDGSELEGRIKNFDRFAVVLDHACTRFVDTYDSPGQPPIITLRALEDGAQIATIFDERDPRVDELALAPPELVTLASRDGATLHGAIFRPPARFGPGP